jgi:O-antigen/teichoic acid export membrane protein
MRVSTAVHYLRAGPFDLSTEAGRSAERYRLATMSILANVLSRGIGMIAMVLGVSLTVPYLGVERFGVWMTIVSFSTMLAFLDLGTGNALTNHVAKCFAHEGPDDVRQAISGGLGFLALIGFVVAIALVSLAAALPWDRLLKPSEPSVATEARLAAMLFGALFGISILSSGIQRVFAGLQRAFEAHAAAAVGSVLSIVGLVAATSRQAGVPVLLLVTLGSQVVSSLFLMLVLAKRRQVTLRCLMKTTQIEAGKLLSISMLFLILQLGVMVGWGADTLIVSSTLGVAQVAAYGVTQRLLQFVSIPLSMVNSPLWAAYADAYARGDTGFIRRTLKRTITVTLILATFGVGLMALISQPVIAHWTHGNVDVNHAFVLIFGVWAILEATGNAFAMFLNGCGILRPQVTSVLLFCILVTPLKFLLAAHFGIIGILIATIGCYLVAVPLLYSTVFRMIVSDTLRASVVRHT